MSANDNMDWAYKTDRLLDRSVAPLYVLYPTGQNNSLELKFEKLVNVENRKKLIPTKTQFD